MIQLQRFWLPLVGFLMLCGVLAWLGSYPYAENLPLEVDGLTLGMDRDTVEAKWGLPARQVPLPHTDLVRWTYLGRDAVTFSHEGRVVAVVGEHLRQRGQILAQTGSLTGWLGFTMGYNGDEKKERIVYPGPDRPALLLGKGKVFQSVRNVAIGFPID